MLRDPQKVILGRLVNEGRNMTASIQRLIETKDICSCTSILIVSLKEVVRYANSINAGLFELIHMNSDDQVTLSYAFHLSNQVKELAEVLIKYNLCNSNPIDFLNLLRNLYVMACDLNIALGLLFNEANEPPAVPPTAKVCNVQEDNCSPEMVEPLVLAIDKIAEAQRLTNILIQTYLGKTNCNNVCPLTEDIVQLLSEGIASIEVLMEIMDNSCFQCTTCRSILSIKETVDILQGMIFALQTLLLAPEDMYCFFARVNTQFSVIGYSPVLTRLKGLLKSFTPEPD